MRRRNTVHSSLSRHRFTVETPGVTVKQVHTELENMLAWIDGEQRVWREREFAVLVERLNGEGRCPSGSLNRWGDREGMAPGMKAPFQAYNYAEMFRQNCASVIRQAQVNTVLEHLTHEYSKAGKVLNALIEDYGWLGFVPYEHIKRATDRVAAKPEEPQYLPRPPRQLPFSACDMHLSPKMKRHRNRMFWSFKMREHGMVTLSFTIPKSGERYRSDNISRPTVYIDKRGRLAFRFDFKQPAPAAKPGRNMLGVDEGKVLPYVATALTSDSDYSAPYLPSPAVNNTVEKINRRWTKLELLQTKAELCRKRGHLKKTLVLEEEAGRVRAKISRLKTHNARNTARHLVAIAEHEQATIVFENLTMFKKSGSWDHAQTQEATENRARRHGIKVTKVNPKNTSQHCYKCNAQVKHRSRRTVYCPDCRLTLNRDINASRNIAKRGGEHHGFTPKPFPRTRGTEPASTPGQTPNQTQKPRVSQQNPRNKGKPKVN